MSPNRFNCRSIKVVNNIQKERHTEWFDDNFVLKSTQFPNEEVVRHNFVSNSRWRTLPRVMNRQNSCCFAFDTLVGASLF